MNSSPESPEHAGWLAEARLLILAAQREGSRQLGASLREVGLTTAQAEVLEVLHAAGELTLAELGRRLVCEAGSPSRLVDSLVRAELVTRTPSAQDRRTVLLALAPEGAARLARLGAAGAPLTAFMAERLDPEQARTLVDLLGRLVRDTPGGLAIARRAADHTG
ncbi:MarR family transcriptional regulator [Kitasatospora sp. NPDC094015]|uniref:MarR family winged helix-turn-helix transcriptional regulator n=1 Tax=Kitasatospora sp. NPDC094015 TaxID=3155205 RepID=UPI003325875A